MNHSVSILNQLISPITTEEFWSNYFEKKSFCHSVSNLNIDFDIEKFEQLLWAHKYDKSENVQVNKDGKPFFYNKVSSGKDHFGWLMDRYQDGCTLIFNGIDKIDPEISAIARALDVEFRGDTTVNAFLTPAHSKGFLPHFDTHDVFICQTDGTKEWSLYGKELESPLDRQIYLIDQEKLGKPSFNQKLSQNSVLYIPRGMVHGSFATDTYSLHLTIGVRPLQADEYLKTFIDIMAEQDEDLRQSIIHKDADELSVLLKKLAAHIESKSDSVYFQKLVNDRINLKNLSSSKAKSVSRIAIINQIDSLTSETLLKKAYPGQDLMTDHADKIRLFFPGIGLSGIEEVQQGFVEMPAIAFGALDFIMKREGAFSAKDMPEFYPMESRLNLLKKLLRIGYLKID